MLPSPSESFLSYSGPSALVYGFWNQFVSFCPKKLPVQRGPVRTQGPLAACLEPRGG